MPRLIFLDPPFAGRVYELVVERTTVGRADTNTLVIGDETVSRAHCEILVWGPEVIVRDLGSRNGTFVADRLLDHHQAQVLSGQIVRFGAVAARLDLDPPSNAIDDEDNTEVHELARILRRQADEEARPRAHAATVAMGPALDTPGETISLRKTPQPEPTAKQPTVQTPGAASRHLARTRLMLAILALSALALVILIWVISSKN